MCKKEDDSFYMAKKKKRGRTLTTVSKFTWILYVVSSLAFLYILHSIGVLPASYMMIIAGILAAFALAFGLIVFFKNANSFNKGLQTLLCTLMAAVLIVGSLGIDKYKEKIRSIFVNTETVTLYVYALKDSPINVADDLGNTKMGLSSLTNQNVQKEAFDDLSGYLNKYELGTVNTETYNGINKIIDALYAHDVDSIMVQSNLIDIIEEIEEYKDFESNVKVVYESTHKVTIKGSDADFKIKNITKDPFVVAVGGRDYNGHFDVNMVAAANPLTKQVLIITMPRDAYSPLGGDPEKMDKLAYTGKLGSDVWFETLQLWFDYQFNFYGIVDFYSVSDVIDALGGIDIYNPYYFTTVGGNGKSASGWDYSFPEGDIHLNGDKALSYCRERYNLPNYDISRNEHQGIVLKALIKKLTSKAIVSNVDSVLEALEEKVATNFTPDLIYKLVNMQLKDNAEWNIVTYNIKGKVFYTYSYMIGHEYGPNYAMMDINKETLAKANSMLKQLLDGEILESD